MTVTSTMTPPLRMGGPEQAKPKAKLAWPIKLFVLTLLLPFGFQVGTLFLNGTRMVVLVLVVPLMLNLLRGAYGKIHLVDIMFLLHVVWMAVAMSVNNPEQMVEYVGSVGPEFLGSYLIGRAYIRTRQDFFALCHLLVWAILLMLPLTLLESQTGRPYVVELIRSIPGISSHGVVSAEQRMGLHRVQGSFSHPIHFGLFCSTAVSLAFFVWKSRISDGQRWFMTALVFSSAFLGLSAGVMMALVSQVGLIVWYLMLRQVDYKWTILTGCLVLLYIAVDIASTRTPIRVFLTYGTFSPHTAYWRTIIFDWGMMNIFGSVENDIPPARMFGIGLNEWVRPSFMYSGSMDNFWLLTGVRYGVPGFAFLAIGYFVTMWKIGHRKDFEGDEELLNMRRAWLIVFVGLTLTLCTVHVWTTIYAYVFFLFGAGIWMLNIDVGQDKTVAAEVEDPNAPKTLRYSRFSDQPRARRS